VQKTLGAIKNKNTKFFHHDITFNFNLKINIEIHNNLSEKYKSENRWGKQKVNKF